MSKRWTPIILLCITLVLNVCSEESPEVTQAAPTVAATETPILPTEIPTATPVPTDTPTPQPTNTAAEPDTSTEANPPTATPLPPTDTPIPLPSPTSTATPDWLNIVGRTEDGLVYRGNPNAPVTLIDYSDFL